MPGLTFLNLAFLAGAAAAAVPVLIHLFSRRHARRIDWSSVRFIREVNRQRIRRIKLRQLLLLILRALAIILFAVAMGRPALTGSFLASGRAPSTVCLIVDTSYSMGASRGGEVTFERARQRAMDVVDLLDQEDSVYLIAVSDRAESATPYPMQDLGQLRERISGLALSSRHGDLAAGLELGARLLRAAKTINKEIYLITDLQASGWSTMLDSTLVPTELPPEVAVCVIGPGETGTPDNVAVREVSARRELVDGGGLHVDVALTNYTSAAVNSVPVEVELEGVKAGETFVDLPPHATVRASIRVEGGPWKDAAGRVHLPEDALAVDDRRFFVTGDEERARIGVLADGDAASQRAAEFVRLALSPEEGTGPFSVRDLSTGELARAQLADLQVVVVTGVSRLDHDGLELVRTFVRDGGGLLILPGERSDLRFYNDRLLPPVLPVKIARVVEAGPADEAFRLVPAVSGHPVFAGFQAGLTERLTRARFRKVVKVVPGGARVLARFRSDLPALIEGERAMLFASSVDRIWNDFPTSGAFVPLLHQVVAYLAGSGRVAGQVTVGTPIERLIAAPAVPVRWQAIGPDGAETALEVVERGDDLLLRLTDTERPGIYRVRAGGGDGGGTADGGGDGDVVRVAVNPDTRESDLSPVAIARLETLFGDRPFSYIPGRGSVEASVQQARYGRELWRFVLVLALAVLVVEVLMSRGRGAFTPAAS